MRILVRMTIAVLLVTCGTEVMAQPAGLLGVFFDSSATQLATATGAPGAVTGYVMVRNLSSYYQLEGVDVARYVLLLSPGLGVPLSINPFYTSDTDPDPLAFTLRFPCFSPDVSAPVLLDVVSIPILAVGTHSITFDASLSNCSIGSCADPIGVIEQLFALTSTIEAAVANDESSWSFIKALYQ